MLSHHSVSSALTAATRREQHLKQHRRRSALYIRTPSPARFALFSLFSLLLLVLVSWTSLLGIATASETAHGDRRARSAPLPAAFVDNIAPAWTGPSLLVLDTRPPPAVPPLMPPTQNHDEATATISAPPSKRSIETDVSASDADFEIPKPFDTALSNNFTNNCANFFKRMLTSDTINNCHPFSLMLQTSSGLFDASKSFIRITQTLEATCDLNSTQCLDGMNALAQELTTDAACKVDYDNNNPQVVQAYNGLIAYEPLYQASCLRDDEGSFCYANAVTNTTSSGADAYPYYLPLGVSMPGGARPTCNSCLQDSMAIFSSFAGNTTQPVSQTYTGAAAQITISCGTNFVNVTAAPLKGAASATTATLLPTITLFTMLFFYIFH